jgi:predicted membrane protein (TIGR00267 family)
VLGVLLFPFLIFNIWNALVVTTALGILILFFLGIFVAKLTGENQIKTAATFIILGIAGAAIGYFIGSLFKIS